MNTVPKTIRHADKNWEWLFSLKGQTPFKIRDKWFISQQSYSHIDGIFNYGYYELSSVSDNATAVFRVYQKGKNPMNQKLK